MARARGPLQLRETPSAGRALRAPIQEAGIYAGSASRIKTGDTDLPVRFSWSEAEHAE
jgi:hypothetical protein